MVKKGRHRRYEEARELKRSSFDDLDSLMERIDEDPFALPTTEQATGPGSNESEEEPWDDEVEKD